MKCAICGKKLSFAEKLRAPAVEEKGELKKFCGVSCLEQYVEEFESRKSCRRCAYFEEPKGQFPDSITRSPDGKFLHDILVAHCKRVDLELKPTIIAIFKGGYAGVYRRRDFYLDAEKCVHYVTKEEYREKALKGEIGVEKEAYYVVCKYCNARYDANKNVSCPNCGAINP